VVPSDRGALMKIADAYEAKHPGLVPGEALDLWMVGVPPSGQFAKTGIASTLFRLCADVGRNRDFKRCVTECTGYYSQTAARRTGFQECEHLAYRDFRFQGRAVFAGIEPPHTDLIYSNESFELENKLPARSQAGSTAFVRPVATSTSFVQSLFTPLIHSDGETGDI
jgi:hypothetical protein